MESHREAPPSRWQRFRAATHRFNERSADVVSSVLSAMWFFWVAIGLALLSLPAVVTAVDDELKLGIGLESFFPEWLIQSSIIELVAWVAQTLIQLAALPVLAYIGKREGELSGRESTELRDEVRGIIESLDLATEGGLESVYRVVGEVRDKLDRLSDRLGNGHR